MRFGKPRIYLIMLFAALLPGCSVNPATGQKQFTGLMPAAQEGQIGAAEHEKIGQQYGFYDSAALNAYVNDIGQRVARDTERPDVTYKFFIIDSPIVNAFALPGGYVYVSRGLLALANSEAELAAVLGHEIGHITARHSAERYSRGVVTGLGAAVLAAATKSADLSQALDLGTNLYMSSYSRDQERQADSLGLRYMTQGGYDARAMSSFLYAMQSHAALDDKSKGRGLSYFSSHPPTQQRVQATAAEAQQFPQGGDTAQGRYFAAIDGMTYGDSAAQGFVRGGVFYHPQMGFAFDVPAGFTVNNMPDAVAATSPTGAVLLFDVAANPQGLEPAEYLSRVWMKAQSNDGGAGDLETVDVNGMAGATASFAGAVNGEPVTIRMLAIAWQDGRVARFQIALPRDAGPAVTNALKRTTYSFRNLNPQDRTAIKPLRLRIITASSGDTVATLAARMEVADNAQARFRALNGMTANETILPGGRYKIIAN